MMMNDIYQEYLLNLRNLVSVYLDNYKCEDFDDEYKEANEFLLNYSFGRYDRGENVLQLEQKFSDSVEKIIKLKL